MTRNRSFEIHSAAAAAVVLAAIVASVPAWVAFLVGYTVGVAMEVVLGWGSEIYTKLLTEAETLIQNILRADCDSQFICYIKGQEPLPEIHTELIAPANESLNTEFNPDTDDENPTFLGYTIQKYLPNEEAD